MLTGGATICIPLNTLLFLCPGCFVRLPQLVLVHETLSHYTKNRFLVLLLKITISDGKRGVRQNVRVRYVEERGLGP